MRPSREELIRRYKLLSSPTVYDVLERMGYPNQALSSSIRPLAHNCRIAGPALTITGASIAKHDSRWGTAISYEMFRSIQPGDVIVFDCGGHKQGGPWGGNTGANARRKGAAGIVIDGGTRDYNDLTDMRFPTFCRFVTPVLAHGRFQINGFNKLVTMSGQVEEQVSVKPGDFVLADDDGIVIVPEALLEKALGYAEAAGQAEEEIRKAIEAGEDRESIDKRIDRWSEQKADGRRSRQQ
jgi:4-hydroxy-4-methyl-2-oxoglutarate aldolase